MSKESVTIKQILKLGDFSPIPTEESFILADKTMVTTLDIVAKESLEKIYEPKNKREISIPFKRYKLPIKGQIYSFKFKGKNINENKIRVWIPDREDVKKLEVKLQVDMYIAMSYMFTDNSELFELFRLHMDRLRKEYLAEE